MTRSLKLFTLCAGVWAALFFAALYVTLEQTAHPGAAGVSNGVVFTVVLTSLESYFRRRDDPRLVRYDLTLAYTVVAASASALVTAGWALAWRQEAWVVLALGAGSVLVILAAAHLRSRGRIKAYAKEDLFR
jgi:hypothetical protein